jgi:hypothetical protein
VAVKEIAGERQSTDNKIVSLSHSQTHLNAELVFLVRFAFGDAFDFRSMQTVELVVIVTLLREQARDSSKGPCKALLHRG